MPMSFLAQLRYKWAIFRHRKQLSADRYVVICSFCPFQKVCQDKVQKCEVDKKNHSIMIWKKDKND